MLPPETTGWMRYGTMGPPPLFAAWGAPLFFWLGPSNNNRSCSHALATGFLFGKRQFMMDDRDHYLGKGADHGTRQGLSGR